MNTTPATVLIPSSNRISELEQAFLELVDQPWITCTGFPIPTRGQQHLWPDTIILAPGCAFFLTGTTGLPPITSNITPKEKTPPSGVSPPPHSISQGSAPMAGSPPRASPSQAATPAGQAGGIFVDTGGTLELSNSRVTQNSAGSGGAGILINSEGNAHLFNTVANNNSAGGQGAGILGNGNLAVVGGIIGFNTVNGRGGGLSVNQGMAV